MKIEDCKVGMRVRCGDDPPRNGWQAIRGTVLALGEHSAFVRCESGSEVAWWYSAIEPAAPDPVPKLRPGAIVEMQLSGSSDWRGSAMVTGVIRGGAAVAQTGLGPLYAEDYGKTWRLPQGDK